MSDARKSDARKTLLLRCPDETDPAATRDNDLIAHIERHIGPIDGGWKMESGSEPLFILKLPDVPEEGAVTYVTLGLSSTPLRQREGFPNLRQELVFSMWAPDDDEHPVALVMAVVSDMLDSGRALKRGEVLGPAGPLLDGVRAEAMYCAAPVYFEYELQLFSGFDTPLYFVWLLSILPDEAEYARREGPDAFEALLDADEGVDVLDLNRASVPIV